MWIAHQSATARRLKDFIGGKEAKQHDLQSSYPDDFSLMPTAMIHHRQLEQFYAATVAAFKLDSLKRVVQFRLGVPLENIIQPGDFKSVVFDLITWAEREGKLRKLIKAIKEHLPDKPQIQVAANSLLAVLPDEAPFLTEALASIATWLAMASHLETQKDCDELCGELVIGVIPPSVLPRDCSAEDRAKALVEYLYEAGDYAAFLKLCARVREQVPSALSLKDKLDAIAKVQATEDFQAALRAAGWIDATFILKAEGSPPPLRVHPKIGITFPKRLLDVGWRW